MGTNTDEEKPGPSSSSASASSKNFDEALEKGGIDGISKLIVDDQAKKLQVLSVYLSSLATYQSTLNEEEIESHRIMESAMQDLAKVDSTIERLKALDIELTKKHDEVIRNHDVLLKLESTTRQEVCDELSKGHEDVQVQLSTLAAKRSELLKLNTAIRTEIQEQLKLIEEEGNVFDTFMASSEEELKGLKEKLVEMDETLGTYQQQLNENGEAAKEILAKQDILKEERENSRSSLAAYGEKLQGFNATTDKNELTTLTSRMKELHKQKQKAELRTQQSTKSLVSLCEKRLKASQESETVEAKVQRLQELEASLKAEDDKLMTSLKKAAAGARHQAGE